MKDKALEMAIKSMKSFQEGTNGLYKGEFDEEIAACEEALVQPPLPVQPEQVSLTDDRWKQAAQYWFGQYRQLITGETNSANKVLDEWFNNNFPPLPVQEPVAWLDCWGNPHKNREDAIENEDQSEPRPLVLAAHNIKE